MSEDLIEIFSRTFSKELTGTEVSVQRDHLEQRPSH